eukprot:7102823-Lingulodinium_polyedra.AAC.1
MPEGPQGPQPRHAPAAGPGPRAVAQASRDLCGTELVPRREGQPGPWCCRVPDRGGRCRGEIARP